MNCKRTPLSLSLLVVLLMAREARGDDVVMPEPPCSDDNEIVGHRRCPAYGEWGTATPEHYSFFEYGVMWRHFDARPKDTPAARSTAMPAAVDAQSTDAFVIAERIGVGLRPGSYFGVEIEVGNFDLAPDDDTSRPIVIGALGVLGVRGDLAPLALGVELGAGCLGISDPDGLDLEAEPVVEARARAAVWLAPWFTVGAVAGASLIERGDWLIGIDIGVHSRAFGGER